MKDERRLLRLVIAVLAVVGTVTTTGRTDAYGYDVSPSALLSVLAPSGPEASPVQPSVTWNKPDSPSGEGRGASSTSSGSFIATEAGTDLVRYDPEWASRQLLDQNLPGSNGYGVTPGGRTVSAHAADVIANGGRGRPPTSLSTVDEILDTGTAVRWDPIKGTVRVTQPGMPGRPFVAVDATTGNLIVTAMVPK